jgi:hypothetical protein
MFETTFLICLLLALVTFRGYLMSFSLKWFGDFVIGKAMYTPYWNLAGYMRRWWLLGADNLARNRDNPEWRPADFARAYRRSKLYQWVTDKVSARIHQTLRSDNDRHLHDHPFWNISIVLRGGYWEDMPIWTAAELAAAQSEHEPYRRVWRGPGAIVFRRASARHRLTLPDGQTSWSLFIVGGKAQPWGFFVPGRGKILRRQYSAESALDRVKNFLEAS